MTYKHNGAHQREDLRIVLQMVFYALCLPRTFSRPTKGYFVHDNTVSSVVIF